MAASDSNPSPFRTTRINSTTFVVREDDAYAEHPFIYVKIHPKAPVIILSDTGCDKASEKHKTSISLSQYLQLRHYLETCPVQANNNSPLNPGGERQYIILVTHCHFDHLGGISQFLEGGTTEIIASAAGRDFIESDLAGHGLFDEVGKPAPWFKVTHWAGAFERFRWPIRHAEDEDAALTKPVDLGITIIQTAGHTPDEIAWYDHEEMHLYVGDSMYEEGEDGMPIVFPNEGNLIEYVFQMHKLQYLIRGENGRAAAKAHETDEMVHVSRRVKLGAGHQTHSADAEEFFETVGNFFWATLRGEVPIVWKRFYRGEEVHFWREEDRKSGVSLQAPKRLMEDARHFFKGSDVLPKRGSWT